jgi:hypothetical protein
MPCAAQHPQVSVNSMALKVQLQSSNAAAILAAGFYCYNSTLITWYNHGITWYNHENMVMKP